MTNEISTLSILIPVYNCDVRNLVKALHQELIHLPIYAEIICYDDFSVPEIKKNNREIAHLDKVLYKELPKNHGRSAIRNLLSDAASHTFLLFLDSDSTLVSTDFLKTYLSVKNADVIVGGRIYPNTFDEVYCLHWLVGTKKEVLPAKIREKHPYRSLMLNNFLIKKEIFDTVKLNENIKGYGHEDTLLGFELQSRNIKIAHIENPVLHYTLQTNEAFLAKTEEAVKNFAWIVKNMEVGKNTPLYKSYYLLKKARLLALSSLLYKLFSSQILKNLHSKQPKLCYLDFFKLNLFYLEMNK